jgi:hypothetical protein
VTRILDPTRALRKASALRALCRRLPHISTPAELARLQRFDELGASPETATIGDVEALISGWRRWWYQGETERLCAMAARVPAALMRGDRSLALYACAAATREAEM